MAISRRTGGVYLNGFSWRLLPCGISCAEEINDHALIKRHDFHFPMVSTTRKRALPLIICS
jgi:hypothetical protein